MKAFTIMILSLLGAILIGCSIEIHEAPNPYCDDELYLEDGIWYRCYDWEYQNGYRYCSNRRVALIDHHSFNPCN